MKRTRKPVRLCYRCPLNLGDTCAAHAWPHEMWHHRRCPDYGSEEAWSAYVEERRKHPPDPRKWRRRDVQKMRSTEPHYQGARDPARR